MRKQNSSIKVNHITEKGIDSIGKTFFAHIPLENMVCYAVAESYDNDNDLNSAKLAVESALLAFERNPSLSTRKIKQYIQYAHEQIVAGSTTNILEVAITIVVSDYTRLRYASCGNVKFYLLNDNTIEQKSITQTYYQNVAEAEGVDKAPFSENKNLVQYLGMDSNPKPYISDKIDLPEKSTMFFATCNFWERIKDTAILDVYEETKQEELIKTLNELFLQTQLQNPEIRSYTIATLFVEKVYKENTEKIKKRNRRIRIIAIIMIIAIIIAAIVITSMRISDRRVLTEIENLNNAGIRYANVGNLSMAHEQYIQASELVDRLRNNWQFRQEKRQVTEKIMDRWNLFERVTRGDNYLENGRLQDAGRSYQEAYNMAWLHPELMIIEMLSDRIRRIEMRITIDYLVQIAGMYKVEGLYHNAINILTEAEAMARELNDLALRRDLLARIFEVNREIDNLFEEDSIRHIRQIQALMARAENDFNLELALQYSEFIINIYRDLGINDRQSLEDRARIERSIELDNTALAYIRTAREAELFLRYTEAVHAYERALALLRELGMSIGNVRYRNVLDEIIRIEGIIEEIRERELQEQQERERQEQEARELQEREEREAQEQEERDAVLTDTAM